MRDADTAMYRAKTLLVAARYVVFDKRNYAPSCIRALAVGD